MKGFAFLSAGDFLTDDDDAKKKEVVKTVTLSLSHWLTRREE